MSQAGQFFNNPVTTLTGDIGGAVEPAAGNIDILSGAGILVTGDPVTNSLTISHSGILATSFPTDAGTGIPVLGALDILGGTNLNTTGAGNVVTVIMNDDVTLVGMLSANEVESTIPIPITSGGTGVTNFPDHGVMVGSGVGAITSLTVGTDGQVLIGSSALDPVFATMTSTAGTITFTPGAGTLNMEADGLDQLNIIYVGKHGNDANDGLTINKAFLTITAAQAAASAGDVVWCCDNGTYTEDITGVAGISIFAPNATLVGAHTLITGNVWTFQQLTVLTATTGLTMATAAQNAYVKLNRMIIAGTGVGVICTDGTVFATIDFIEIENGYFVESTTDDQVQLYFGEMHIIGTGTAFSCVTGGAIQVVGDSISNSGAGNGTIFATAGGGTPIINLTISSIDSEKLSNITAASLVRLNVGSLTGTLTEIGAGLVTVGGATRIDNVPIGATTRSTGAFTSLSANANLDVTGTVQFTSIVDGGLYVDGTGLVAASAAIVHSTGFATWTGAGAYFDDTVLGDFEVLRGGTGYINSVPITWAGPQTIGGMTAGNTYLIYMDDTGTIGKTTAFTQATFDDYIVLFQCLRDSTAGTNIQHTVKENHPWRFCSCVSFYCHEVIGTVIENNMRGANITLNGTQKIEIVGADELSDHGLYTDIPNSGGVAETWTQMYTDGAGKWARYAASDTFNGFWNSAGTPTAPTGTKFSVYTLYVSKDNITSALPTYWAVLDDQEYNNLVMAQTAIADGSVAEATTELAALEFAQLGQIIYKQSTSTIVDVLIEKSTLRGVTSTNLGTNDASLVLTTVTNFDGILSATDTTVQVSLDTIDEWGKTTTDHAVLIGNGTGNPIGSLAVGTNGQVIVGSTGADPVFANIGSTDSSLTITEGAGTLVIEGTAASEIQVGSVELATDAEAIAGADTIRAIVPTSLKAKLGTQTDHGVLVGSGTAAAITALTVGTNGQVVVGSTGADPVFANITSTDSSLTITEGAGTLVIEGTASSEIQPGSIELATDAEAIAGADTVRAIVPTSLKAKLGTQTNHGVLVGAGTAAAVTALAVGTNGQVIVGSTGADPVFANITSTGGTISFTLGAGTLNVEAAAGSGMAWAEVTGTSQAMAVGNGYILNNAALVTATLPATAAVGSLMRIVGKGAGGWKVAQNAGQTIYFSSSTTTPGAGGSLDSTEDHDSLQLVCTTADTDFTVISSIGNITVT